MGTPAKLGALIFLVIIFLPIQGTAQLIEFLPSQGTGQLIEDEFKPFDDANFLITGKDSLRKAFWVVGQYLHTPRVGFALYHDVNRRYNLLDMKGRYSGFIQATMMDFEPEPLYKQYLWYDRDNNYKAVFVRQLGGRLLPWEPETPPRLRQWAQGPPPGSYGTELGGQWYPFRLGNIPLAPPEEKKFRVFPDEVEEELRKED